MQQWAVYSHGNPEKVLFIAQHKDDFTAYQKAMNWARKHRKPWNTTVDKYPPKSASLPPRAGEGKG